MTAMKLPPKLVQQGAEAESRFRVWLDASRLPHIYTDQTRESVPVHFRRHMKRPDYLVALPYVGTIAFDVKCKTTYGKENTYVFDVAEIRKLATFDKLFRITTFFACLSLDGSRHSYWFGLDALNERINGLKGGTIGVHPEQGLPVDMDRPFQDALADALHLNV